MGIKGLGGFIKWKVPQARKSLKWTTHAGSRWGIDCSCLLYRARGVSLSPMTVIAGLIVRMRRASIEPIFVFDGRTPTAKSDTVDQRRVVRQAAHKEMADIQTDLTDNSGNYTSLEKITLEQRHAALQKKAPTVSSGEKDEIKQLLYAAGVMFITAAGEADDVLAYLCRDGTIQAVLSTDMDMLARGVPALIVPETNDATVLTEIGLADVLTGLRLQYVQFVDACMLMGSDYSGKGWRTVDPRTAVEMARKGVDWTMIDASGSMCSAMENGVAILTGSGVTWASILSEKQQEKWAAQQRTAEPANLTLFAEKYGWPTDWVLLLGSTVGNDKH